MTIPLNNPFYLKDTMKRNFSSGYPNVVELVQAKAVVQS